MAPIRCISSLVLSVENKRVISAEDHVSSGPAAEGERVEQGGSGEGGRQLVEKFDTIVMGACWMRPQGSPNVLTST